jgi:hypothetical protein
MEPRQPDEANQSPSASPNVEASPEANLSNTPSPQPEKRSGNQSRNNRQNVPYRDNNDRVAPASDEPGGADQPERSFKPVQNQRNKRVSGTIDRTGKTGRKKKTVRTGRTGRRKKINRSGRTGRTTGGNVRRKTASGAKAGRIAIGAIAISPRNPCLAIRIPAILGTSPR